MWSPRCAEGSAILITVASSATISWATEIHTSASRRREDLLSAANLGAELDHGLPGPGVLQSRQ